MGRNWTLAAPRSRAPIVLQRSLAARTSWPAEVGPLRHFAGPRGRFLLRRPIVVLAGAERSGRVQRWRISRGQRKHKAKDTSQTAAEFRPNLNPNPNLKPSSGLESESKSKRKPEKPERGKLAAAAAILKLQLSARQFVVSAAKLGRRGSILRHSSRWERPRRAGWRRARLRGQPVGGVRRVGRATTGR